MEAMGKMTKSLVRRTTWSLIGMLRLAVRLIC